MAVQTMWPVFLAGANYVMHAAGWMEAGLAASFAKFVLDAEQIEMFYRFGQGPQFDDFEEALAAVREIGPGGHYLGTEHTQSHFQTAFFMPELADNNSFEQWQLDGSKTPTPAPSRPRAACSTPTSPRPSTPRSTRPL